MKIDLHEGLAAAVTILVMLLITVLLATDRPVPPEVWGVVGAAVAYSFRGQVNGRVDALLKHAQEQKQQQSAPPSPPADAAP